MRERKLDLLVDEAELERAAAASEAPPVPERGYARLYADQVLGADEGCDFAFLKRSRASDRASARIAAE